MQLQVCLIYFDLAGLSHGLLSISAHCCAQRLSHQEVSAQFQHWRVSGEPLGLVHSCTVRPVRRAVRVFQAFLHLSSPFIQQKTTEGGMRITPLGFIPSCAIDLPGDKRCSDGRGQHWSICHLNENEADCF